AYFGEDVRGIVERLLREQLPDGGWNCAAPKRSNKGSFNTTICVLEALLECEQTASVIAARRGGEAYLLERRLFRRKATGEAIGQDWQGRSLFQALRFPGLWHLGGVRSLGVPRRRGGGAGRPLADAVQIVASRRERDGWWTLEVQHPGVMPIE